MKKFLTAILVLAVIGLAVFWFVTMPKTIGADALVASYQPNLKNGEEMFHAGGCAGCHPGGHARRHAAEAHARRGGAPRGRAQ